MITATTRLVVRYVPSSHSCVARIRRQCWWFCCCCRGCPWQPLRPRSSERPIPIRVYVIFDRCFRPQSPLMDWVHVAVVCFCPTGHRAIVFNDVSAPARRGVMPVQNVSFSSASSVFWMLCILPNSQHAAASYHFYLCNVRVT